MNKLEMARRWKTKIRLLALIRVGFGELICKCGKNLVQAIQAKHLTRWQRDQHVCACGEYISKVISETFKKIHCSRCGINDIRILQINHKNLDGNRERKKEDIWKFYRKIAHYKRDTDDLEILCTACNWIHFLEKKYEVAFHIKA